MCPVSESSQSEAPFDLGEYCRGVEEHLARVNEGHIIRIVGPAFEMVRAWALEGIPLGIVCRGIDAKAERHRAGRSMRPLRLEFCEGDVRALYDDWRRAVGAWSPDEGSDAASEPLPPAVEERRRPSITRQLDRAIERVVAASGSLDLPDGLPDALTAILDDLVALRDQLRHARGAARQALAERLVAIDRAIGDAARAAAGTSLVDVESEARRELAAFRNRLPAEAWERSVRAGADRLLRERYNLPTLDPGVVPEGQGS
jgi:hypothetical protein